ncbi:MAG: hypothetical protein HYX68_11065 [Planctomycetes bacterium]|nr:hypothetical protein [Planctomycetota bacterium]
MLSEKMIQLVTAFVDGELTQRQRKAVVRLLEKSSAARALLKELQENAHRLKKLPQRKVEPSLVEDVLKAIAETQAQPAAPAPVRGARRRWLPHVAASLAASLLIVALGIVCWNAFQEPGGPATDKSIAKNDGTPKKKVEPKAKPGPVVTPTPKPVNPLIGEIIAGTARDFGATDPVVQVFAAQFQDFQKPMVLDRFSTELREKRTVQFDVTVKNNFVAMERLKAALNEHGVLIESDPSATKDLQGKAKREFWVYADNLTHEELTQIVQELAKADTTGKGKRVESPYKKLTLTPITSAETQKVARLLGVEPSKLQLPKDKVGNPKRDPSKRWDRSVVVLPTTPGATPSEEIRRFVNQRRPQGDSIQVLIKIRQN